MKDETITNQRKVIRIWAKENLSGKSFESEIGAIYISGKNINAAISQNHDSEFEKNNALYKLPQLIKESKYLKQAPDSKNRPVNWHYFEIAIAGKKSYLNIKEDWKTRVKAFYSITDKLKEY